MQYAIRGLQHVYVHERNFRFQCFVTVFVVLAAIFFRFDTWEFVLITLLSVSVLTLEVLNSAVEVVLDILKPRLSGQVGIAKDIMAGAVLLVSLCSFFVGVVLFYPHVLELFYLFWYTV